jgi:TatD DNase family protein
VTEYFDSHCHLTATAFRDDREAVLRSAFDAGVTRLVCIASDLSDAREALAFAEELSGRDAVEGEARAPAVWSTAGVHPHEAGKAATGDVEIIGELAREHDCVVAIGETGLDYHYDHAPRPVQRALFDAHLALGADTGLPVVVHAREADEDVAAALRGMPDGTLGVLHCFTGGDLAFAAAMDAGWYVSFSGIASFRSFEPVELLREVPTDRLLIETDAPYLAPVPFRGKRNVPANVVHVAAAVASHLGVDPQVVAASTTENARRFYGV